MVQPIRKDVNLGGEFERRRLVGSGERELDEKCGPALCGGRDFANINARILAGEN